MAHTRCRLCTGRRRACGTLRRLKPMLGGWARPGCRCPLQSIFSGSPSLRHHSRGDSSLGRFGYDGLCTLIKKTHRDRLGNDTVSLQYAPWKDDTMPTLLQSESVVNDSVIQALDATSAGAGPVPEGSCPHHTWARHRGAGWRASGWVWPRRSAEPAASRDLVYRA